MNKILVLFISVLTVAGFYGCKKNNPAPDNTGSVMFVNGCAGVNPGLDAKVDYVNVSGAANLGFTATSGYKYIKTGTAVHISYYITNAGTLVTDQTVNVATNVSYSAFSGGRVTAPNFLFTTDDLTAPTANNAKIRFVNLSDDALAVTANASTTVIGTGITTLNITSFIQVVAGNYELKAGDPTDISTVVSTGTTALGAGRIYTLMLTGSKMGTGTSALKLTLISNN